MSSKKKKRLDKYIVSLAPHQVLTSCQLIRPSQDKKLRKEENLELIKKLAGNKVDTGLLKSSRSLGATKASKRDVLSQALNETRAGINVKGNRDVLFRTRRDDSDASLSSEESMNDGESAISRPAVAQQSMVGSGLKRPLEMGPDGNPILKKRRRNGPIQRPLKPQVDESSSWEGFSDDGSVGSAASLSSITSSQANRTDSSDDSDSESELPSSEGEISEEGKEERKARSSAFKAWATSQVNQAIGFTPSSTVEAPKRDDTDSGQKMITIKPRAPEIDPLPPELAMENRNLDRKTFSVNVDRSSEIQEARMQLPIVPEEQRIMEAIHNNSTVVVCGETGSGKTTQVPQFLYEAGYGHPEGPYPGLIGITQPRRVAAVSMATRVGVELGGEHARKVAHQIRFDSSTSRNTAVKFMTDGILIREIAKDFVLSRYSVVIVDEAHERSTNTDILIGLLSRIVDLRETMSKEDAKTKPLKLIIMSATLRIQDFLENKMLFRDGPPPLVQVEGRQYPVTIHFSRRTQSDYLEQAFQKIRRGHQLLPPGSMLVFLTGQDEITTLSKRLKEAFPDTQGDSLVIEPDCDGSSEEEEDEFVVEIEDATPSNKTPAVHVLPLYSQLKTEDQLRVFEPVPEGSRMVVLATNVAETSLTIPGIRYVIDCGRAKERKYDDRSGVQSFEIDWISKASASQRAGRAGRTGPGHCYRLYSSAIYERDFQEHAEPEILRMPAEGVVLQLKSMELHNVINFPFPSPPDRHSLAKAERLLMYLGALTSEGRITPMGRELSAFPLSPRYAKMLAVGHQFNCMAFTILLVAALATPNLFIPEAQLGLVTGAAAEISTTEDRVAEEARLKRRSDYNHAHHLCSKYSKSSDGLKAFAALQGYLKADAKEEYCKSMFLSLKSMQEASNLAAQLESIVRIHAPLHFSGSSAKLASPSKDQVSALQQFAAAGFLDQIALLASEAPSPPYLGRSPKRAVDVPYLPLFRIDKGRRTSEVDIRDVAVYVHPSSILAHVAVKEMPKYIIYSHLQRSAPATVEGAKKPRTRMHALTTVTEKTMAALAKGTPLLEYSKPLSIMEERMGEKGKIRTCIVQPSLIGEKRSLGWPLPAQKIVQARNARGEWVVE